MRQIPYIKSPAKNGCALACHLMVAKTFFPETTLDDLKAVLRWKDGCVVWGFPFWLWLIDRGAKVVDIDTFPYQIWAEQGFSALKEKIPVNNFDYINRWTANPSDYQKDIRHLFSSEGFSYDKRVPELSDLRAAFDRDAVCEVTLDSCALNGREGFAIHRVVVLDVTESHVIFHDPARPEDMDMPNRSEPIKHFLRAWPPSIRELCIYSLE